MHTRITVAAVSLLAALMVVAAAHEARAQAPTLGIQINDTNLRPGETLVTGVTVSNPGGGPLADFYFVIVLPDGATAVSAGLGVGVRFGRLGDVRSLVPVATSISLANPFPYAANPFFSYAFTGIEPIGTYRIYFAAVRAGAFGDGIIGPGDLLAVAIQDFTVGNSPITVDSLRTSTATVSPSGGVVQTTSANGTLLKLTLPPGAVNVATPISIAPIVSFQGSPGPLVAGISAGPSGLRLSPPATLTITLPPGFQPSAFGLRGVLTDDTGQNREFVPVAQVGNVVTMTVSHFSVAEIEVLLDIDEVACAPSEVFPFPPEQAAACAAIDPLADAEAVRLAGQGGPISQTFKDSMTAVLDVWLTNGLLPRLLDAQSQAPGLPGEKAVDVAHEWNDWLDVYRVLFGITDRTNQSAGRPLGAKVDLAQERLRLALLAAMNAVNIQCLAAKSDVDRWVFAVDYFLSFWDRQFPGGAPAPPFDVVFCVDLRIDAAPPPVLTPGQAALFPVDVRLRFTDGVDLPGRQAAIAVSATSATVTPAGGVITLPLAANLTLLPSATASTVTITAAVVPAPGQPLDLLPSRTRTFQAGQVVSIPITFSQLFARVVANLPGRNPAATDSKSTFAPTQSVVVAMDESATSGSTTFRATSQSSSTRTVGAANGALTITGSGTESPQLQVTNPGANVGASTNTGGAAGYQHTTCVSLPTPHTATYSVGTNAPGAKRPNSNSFIATLEIDSTIVNAPDGGSVLVQAGERCIKFFAEAWSCSASNVGVVTCFTPSPLAWNYTVTLRPAP